MKKGLTFLLLTLLTNVSLAQERIVLLRDTTRLNLSLAGLEKQYPPALARKPGEKGLFVRQSKSFLDSLNAVYQRLYQYIEDNKRQLPILGSSLQTQEFVRPDGTYEWVFCEFSGKELTDQQEVQLLQFVARWYSQHPFPMKSKTGFRWVNTIGLGTTPSKRTVRRGPGIISTLLEAEKTTRPDTVKMLALNQLDLQAVPELVYQFPNLEELDLSKNNLSQVPARLTADIPSLRRLSLLYNRIPDDSVFMTRNRHLTALNLQGNKLTKLPRTIRQNRHLESLWMGNNKLGVLDIKTLRRMRRLTDLNLYNSGLTQLPKGIGKLKHLKVLDVYYNKFTQLPSQMGRMKRLEQLAVSHNDLNELPASLARLRNLQVLYAHHNRISQLPTQFKDLCNLKVLNVGYNWFTVAPTVLGSLVSLEELDLNNNNLQEFPSALLSLKNLRKVFLGNNPLFGQEAMNSPYANQIRQLETNRVEVAYD